MRSVVPGKLILSGEHAVVHGAPALVLAVNRHAETEWQPRSSAGLRLEWAGAGSFKDYSAAELDEIAERLPAQYARFLRGEIPIRAVVREPAELMAFGVGLADRETGGKFLAAGRRARIRTRIPLGCGMGSSAAVLLSLMQSVLAEADCPADRERLYALAMTTEQLQHGRQSGADAYACLHGGCIRFCAGRPERRLELAGLRFLAVHTGVPECSTGECVEQVGRNFSGHPIWREFTATTDEMETALRGNDPPRLQAAVRANHALLCKIGVVPERVRSFARAVEALGGAAKICGAGAVRGEKGGMALVLGEAAPMLDVCREFGYDAGEVQEDRHGARLV